MFANFRLSSDQSTTVPRLLYHTKLLALLSCITCGTALSQSQEQAQEQAQTLQRDISADSELTTTVDAAQGLKSEFKPLSLLTGDLWERLGKSFEFSGLNNPRIEEQLKFLNTGGPELNKKLVKATPFLFHIADQLERAEIPLDIALLPLIESAFNPVALSSEGAAGLWQFIPATASHYDLTVEKHLDQRLDVIASTRAAVRYLNDLNLQFDGDWLLTLAAYNTGPGNVRKALRQAIQNGAEPTYWNLKLSTETQNYVPRLIAASKLISNPQKYGLTLPPVPDQKKIQSTDVGRRISLHLVAELTSSAIEELRELNPGLPNERTPIYGPHRLTLPVDVSSRLLDRIKKLEHLPLLDRQTQLEMVRRNISTPLASGSPTSKAKTLAKSRALVRENNDNSDKNNRFETHTVRYGDTLWSLSKTTGIDIDTLRLWNNLADDEPIRQGESLNIAYLTPDSENAGLMNYRVIPSDSLSTIAEKFHLAISDIRRWNTSVRNEDHIQAGQLLRIPTYPTTPVQHTQ